MPPVKPKQTQAQRREASQRRILEASERLIAEKGYDRFSLQDVGRAAGCSYELINHYFTNKEGLLAAVGEHIARNFSMISHNLPQQADAFENLVQQIRNYMGVPERNFVTFCAYMRIASEAPFHPPLRTLVLETRRDTRDVFADAIRSGQVAGAFRADIDAEELSAIIYEFLRGHTAVRLLDLAPTGEGVADAPVRAASAKAFIALLQDLLLPAKPAKQTARKRKRLPVAADQ